MCNVFADVFAIILMAFSKLASLLCVALWCAMCINFDNKMCAHNKVIHVMCHRCLTVNLRHNCDQFVHVLDV